MIVVADTSPLNYLIEIECQHFLPVFYDHVLVAPAVLRELSHADAPVAVRVFLQRMPQWIVPRIPTSLSNDESLDELDAGERETIQLALQTKAGRVLIDERRGAHLAALQGLAVTGTLGVLILASRQNMIDIEEAIRRLKTTGFRCTEGLLQDTIRLASQL